MTSAAVFLLSLSVADPEILKTWAKPEHNVSKLRNLFIASEYSELYAFFFRYLPWRAAVLAEYVNCRNDKLIFNYSLLIWRKDDLLKIVNTTVHLCGSSHGSLRFHNRRELQETANIPRRPWTNRIDCNQNVNLPRPSARQPQPFADQNIRRTAENRGLNRMSW